MTEQLLQLDRDITALENLRKERELNQIKYPLDDGSLAVIEKDIVFHSDFDVVPAGLASPYNEFIEVDINGRKYLLNTTKVVLV